MRNGKLHREIGRWIKILQKFADRWWYPPWIAVLSALDNFIIVIPNDGILISSSMLQPRRWLIYAIFVAIGSTVGAALLAWAVAIHGLPWILSFYPDLEQTRMWLWTVEFFDHYGMYLVLFVAMTPLAQQPTVILATISHIPIQNTIAVVFFGRLIKYLVMSYVGSHAPKLLSKFWGVQEELEEVGVLTSHKERTREY